MKTKDIKTTKVEFLRKLRATPGAATNHAILNHIARVEIMPEEQFQRHYAALQERKAKHAFTAQVIAAEFFNGTGRSDRR